MNESVLSQSSCSQTRERAIRQRVPVAVQSNGWDADLVLVRRTFRSLTENRLGQRERQTTNQNETVPIVAHSKLQRRLRPVMQHAVASCSERTIWGNLR